MFAVYGPSLAAPRIGSPRRAQLCPAVPRRAKPLHVVLSHPTTPDLSGAVGCLQPKSYLATPGRAQPSRTAPELASPLDALRHRLADSENLLNAVVSPSNGSPRLA